MLTLFNIDDFYPTGRETARELISKVTILPGEVILEPSAGRGDLADVIREMFPDNPIYCIEKNPVLAQELKQRGYHGWCTNFLTWDWRLAGAPRPDVIIANPPFRNNFQDGTHFLHALKLLGGNGKLSFILHEYTAFPKYNSGMPRVVSARIAEMGLHKRRMGQAFREADRPTNTSVCFVWGQLNALPNARLVYA